MSDGKKDVSTVAAKQPGVKKPPNHIVQPPKNISYGPVVPHLKPGISHQLCSILLILLTLKDLKVDSSLYIIKIVLYISYY